MWSRVEQDADGASRIKIMLEFELEFDEPTGGYVVIENDGPTRKVRWGPMSHTTAEYFIRERSNSVVDMFQYRAHEMAYNRSGGPRPNIYFRVE